MDQISPLSSIHRITNETVESFAQSHFAYQTPPYEPVATLRDTTPPRALTNAQEVSPLTSPQRVSPARSLIEKIIKLMSVSTARFNANSTTDKSSIINAVTKNRAFVAEVLKRSKSNRLIAVLAARYFKAVYAALQETPSNELPEFAKCSKRILLTCLILSHKYINDNTFSMKTWSSISGLNARDLSTMERWCLHKMDYNLYVEVNDILASENETFSACTKTESRSYKRHLDDDCIEDAEKVRKIAKVNN